MTQSPPAGDEPRSESREDSEFDNDARAAGEPRTAEDSPGTLGEVDESVRVSAQDTYKAPPLTPADRAKAAQAKEEENGGS